MIQTGIQTMAQTVTQLHNPRHRDTKSDTVRQTGPKIVSLTHVILVVRKVFICSV